MHKGIYLQTPLGKPSASDLRNPQSLSRITASSPDNRCSFPQISSVRGSSSCKLKKVLRPTKRGPTVSHQSKQQSHILEQLSQQALLINSKPQPSRQLAKPLKTPHSYNILSKKMTKIMEEDSIYLENKKGTRNDSSNKKYQEESPSHLMGEQIMGRIYQSYDSRKGNHQLGESEGEEAEKTVQVELSRKAATSYKCKEDQEEGRAINRKATDDQYTHKDQSEERQVLEALKRSYSQPVIDTQLPYIVMQRSSSQVDMELQQQRQTISRILADKKYLLSMEYLRDGVDQFQPGPSLNESKQTLLKPKLRYFKLKSLRPSPRREEPKIYKKTYQDMKFQHLPYQSNCFAQSQPERSSFLSSLVGHNTHLHSEYSHLQMGPNKNSLQTDVSRVLNQLPADPNNREQQELMNKILLKGRAILQKGPPSESQACNKWVSSKPLEANVKDYSQRRFNLLRQKLNSSSGRKHFIVAFNLSETLKENSLELECKDYNKIKSLIGDISKKRFESRTNRVKSNSRTGQC